MPSRKAHGTAAKGGAAVVWENLPFDELPRPDPQAAPTGPVARRSDGTVADSASARELGRRGGRKSQLYTRILRSLGLTVIRRPGNLFATFPPLAIVIARKL